MGATSALDIVGSQNGTNSGIVAGVADILPTSDGSTCYTFAAASFVNLINPFAYGTGSQFAVEFWFKLASLAGSPSFYQNGIDAHGNNIWIAGTNLEFSMDNAANTSGGFTAATGVVHHLVGGYDGTTIRIYIDAVQVLSGARAAGSAPQTSNYIGRWSGLDGASFSGQMQKVLYYNQMLTSAQVTANHNAGLNGPPVTNTVIDAGTGVFTLSGKNAQINIQSQIRGQAGVFALSGKNAQFGFSGGPAAASTVGGMEAGNGSITGMLPGTSVVIMGPIQTPFREGMREVVNVQASGAFHLDYQFSPDGGITWYTSPQVPSTVTSADGTTTTNAAHVKLLTGFLWQIVVRNSGTGSINVAYEKRLIRRGLRGA